MAAQTDDGQAWRIGQPIAVGSLTLWAIARHTTHVCHPQAACWCAMRREPMAVLVRDGTGLRAIGIDGQPLALDALRERVTDLDHAIGSA